jgi:phage tail P2-like protein
MSSELLPPNASQTSRALADAFGQELDIPVPNYTLWDPQSCPANILPWLAWSLSVDEWDDNWTEEQKRDAISASVTVHRQKGTIGALKRALQAIGYDVEVDEDTGQAYTFRLAFDLNQTGPLDSKTFAMAKRVALANKNARSHLLAVQALMQSTAQIYVGAAHCRADDVSITCDGISPYVYEQPQGAALWVGYPFTLTSRAMGTEPISIQWFKDGSPISGATSNSYSVASAREQDFGHYYARFTNSIGSVQSNTIAVASAPLFTQQPQDYRGMWSVPVTFSVEVVGTAPITYQWYKNGAPINGATATSYTISSVSDSDEGSYTCRATNQNGSTLSEPATLEIYFEPPQPVTVVNDHPAVVEISWQPYQDPRVQVDNYELQYSLDGNNWFILYTGPALEFTHSLSVTGTYIYRLRVSMDTRTSDWSSYVTFNADNGVMGGIYLNASLGDSSAMTTPYRTTTSGNMSISGSLGISSSLVNPTKSVGIENLALSVTLEGNYE